MALWHRVLTHLFAEYRGLGHLQPGGAARHRQILDLLPRRDCRGRYEQGEEHAKRCIIKRDIKK